MDISGDAEVLSDYDPTAYDRTSVTVDLVLLGIHRRRLSALLVRRDPPPQAGTRALHGGIVALDENIHDAAARLIRDHDSTDGAPIEELYSFVTIEPNPCMRMLTIDSWAVSRKHR